MCGSQEVRRESWELVLCHSHLATECNSPYVLPTVIVAVRSAIYDIFQLSVALSTCPKPLNLLTSHKALERAGLLIFLLSYASKSMPLTESYPAHSQVADKVRLMRTLAK